MKLHFVQRSMESCHFESQSAPFTPEPPLILKSLATALTGPILDSLIFLWFYTHCYFVIVNALLYMIMSVWQPFWLWHCCYLFKVNTVNAVFLYEVYMHTTMILLIWPRSSSPGGHSHMKVTYDGATKHLRCRGLSVTNCVKKGVF